MPHQRKYVLSRPLRRSARCAFVSFTVSVMGSSRIKKAGRGSPAAIRLPAFVFAFDLCLCLVHPVYMSGTPTHALQRLHFAVTRPEAPSTFRMEFLMTTSPALFTTTLAPHTWQRPGASWVRPLSKARGMFTQKIIPIFIGIVKITCQPEGSHAL